MSYIELSVRDFQKPEGREIPRPRLRYEPPEIKEPAKINVPRPHVPKLNIEKFDTRPRGYDQLFYCACRTPAVFPVMWPVGSPPGTAYATRSELVFDMLRMRIESRKNIRTGHASGQIEGRVEVGFLGDR
ncbi:MAG: hypothetical protein R2860_05550 [Desulfobacterales bacterium]